MTPPTDVGLLAWATLIRQAEATRVFLEKGIVRLPHVTGVELNLRIMVEGTVTAPGAPLELLELLLDDMAEQVARQYPELLVDLFVVRAEEDPDDGGETDRPLDQPAP